MSDTVLHFRLQKIEQQALKGGGEDGLPGVVLHLTSNTPPLFLENVDARFLRDQLNTYDLADPPENPL